MSSNLLIAGQSLRLPPASTPATSSGNATRTERVVYQVRPGDTLFQIAMVLPHFGGRYPRLEPRFRTCRSSGQATKITIHMPR